MQTEQHLVTKHSTFQLLFTQIHTNKNPCIPFLPAHGVDSHPSRRSWKLLCARSLAESLGSFHEMPLLSATDGPEVRTLISTPEMPPSAPPPPLPPPPEAAAWREESNSQE